MAAAIVAFLALCGCLIVPVPDFVPWALGAVSVAFVAGRK